ncbi:hypothetical protein NX059_006692 [Plenodomus lindquistii]|nr:hypothetical protein NX059_006692 [Plenodomus lindquistii]
MAPTPVDNTLTAADPTSTPTPHHYWTKPNIAVTIVFGLLFLGVIAGLLLFVLHRRSQAEKLAKRLSTHNPDKAGLLANEDKTNSMFSRHRASSITLYVDSEADARSKRTSVDTMSLVPLQVTPAAEEVRDPMNNSTHSEYTTTGTSTATLNNNNINNNTTESTGSGISALSRTTHTSTLSSLLLSPVSSSSPAADDRDLGLRPAPRARSTSTSSQRARYYESVPLNAGDMPPIPRIVHSSV